MTERSSTENGSEAELDRHLRRLFEQTKEQPKDSEVPTDSELWDFANARLSKAEEDRLVLRLADHPEAMDRLLDFRQGLEALNDSGDARSATSGDVQSRIDAIQARTADVPRPESGTGAPRGIGVPANEDRPRFQWRGVFAERSARAASFLLVVLLGLVIGQWLQVEDLRSRITQMEQEGQPRIDREAAAIVGLGAGEPTANLQIVDLFQSDVRGEDAQGPGLGETEGQEIQGMLIDGRPSILLVTPVQSPARSIFQGWLTDESGREKWRGRLVSDESGLVTLLLPAGFLSPGIWSLHLEPLELEEAEEERFLLQVVPLDLPEE